MTVLRDAEQDGLRCVAAEEQAALRGAQVQPDALPDAAAAQDVLARETPVWACFLSAELAALPEQQVSVPV
jgi:hypothetical protein